MRNRMLRYPRELSDTSQALHTAAKNERHEEEKGWSARRVVEITVSKGTEREESRRDNRFKRNRARGES